jgi:hypothetical protein
MRKELEDKIKKAFEEERAIDDIRTELISQGFMEEEVVETLQRIHGPERSREDQINNRLLTVKEIFDRIGYGFGSVQFINILFYMTGAGFFLIGVVNGLKTIFSLIISSSLQEYSKARTIGKRFMSKAGILFGLSFLFISLAVVIQSWALFSLSLLVGSVGVVTYGDLYNKLVEETLKKEKMSRFLLRISHYGVIITGVSLLLAGYLFDKFPAMGANVVRMSLFGKSFPVFGYLISFEITTLAFILSGYVLHFIKEKKIEPHAVQGFLRDYSYRLKAQSKSFFKNKYLLVLLLASSITGLVQILGNSYYGIFIYTYLKNFNEIQGLNLPVFQYIALIFAFTIAVSFLGPAFSNYLNKKVGLAPTFVFGALLLAMMPLVAVYNPNMMSISVANSLSVLGASIMGMSQGLLVRKILNEENRKLYFATLSIAVIIPFLIFIPIGAWLAQTHSLVFLFRILAIIILVIAAPIYFLLVLLANKLRL